MEKKAHHPAVGAQVRACASTVLKPPVASAPGLSTLTRSVVPVCRSRRKTSSWPLVSPATRSVALEMKATIATVVTDRRPVRRGSPAAGLGAGAGEVHALGGAGLPVPHEDVARRRWCRRPRGWSASDAKAT